MKTEIIYKEKHNELIDKEKNENYAPYTEYFNKNMKQFNYLSEILKDIKCKLIIQPSKDSWCNYRITLEYKNQIFTIKEDRKQKLSVYIPKLWQYENKLTYNQEYKEYKEKHKPLKYTFYKLTTKKLIEVLNYYLNVLMVAEELTKEKQNNNETKYNEYIEKINFIAKHLKIEVKKLNDDTSKQIYIYTPLERLEVIFSYHDLNLKYSYNIDKYVEMIKTILKK
jgi:hypothetical protein